MDSPYLFKFRMRCNSARCAQSASWFKTLPSSSSFLKLTLNEVPLKFQMRNCSHVKFKDFGHNTIFMFILDIWLNSTSITTPWKTKTSFHPQHPTDTIMLCNAIQSCSMICRCTNVLIGCAFRHESGTPASKRQRQTKLNPAALISMLKLNSSVRLEEVLWLFWVLSRCTDFWHFLI